MDIKYLANNVPEKSMENTQASLKLLQEEMLKPLRQQKPSSVIFKAFRVALGLTQVEFGNLLNVQSRSVSRWETGGAIPNLTYDQFSDLAYELRKIGIDLLRFHCYVILIKPNEYKNVAVSPLALN